jgi:hypothetical protein
MAIDLKSLTQRFSIPKGRVIHAGASLCQERDEYRDVGFSPVIWLEAISAVADVSRELLTEYSGQTIFNVTLWSESDLSKEFYVSSNQGESSSLLRMKWHRYVHETVSQSSSEFHSTVTLDKFLDLEHLNGPWSMLVFDLQGAELEALRGSLKTLKNTVAIYTEVALLEMYKGQPLFKDIDSFMAKNGFVLVWSDLDASTTMGDALYVSLSHAAQFGLKQILPPVAKRHTYLYFLRIREVLVHLGIPRRFLRRPWHFPESSQLL